MLGNLTNVDYAISTDLTLQYDALNRLTNRVDALGTTRFSYNTSGLPEAEDGPWADDTVSYSYTQRRLTGLSLLRPSASAWSQSFGYDPAQRLTNIVTAAGTFGYAYEAARPGLLNRQNLPGGSHVDYAYDALARATNIACLNQAAQQLDRQVYALNNGDQITRHTRGDGSYVDYTYDKLGQLVSAKGKESGGANRLHEQLGYTYDAAGNLNYRTNNALTQTFGVNARNELTTISRSGTYTVAGTTASGTTNLTVNFLGSSLYTDLIFASAGHNLADGTNSFTRAYGRGWAETNTRSRQFTNSVLMA